MKTADTGKEQMPDAAAKACEACGNEDPAKALAAGYGFVASVVDDSHFRLQIKRCERCGREFLFVFTEIIDWENGDDRQYFDLMPLTGEEVQTLVRLGEGVSLDELMRWSETRRVLQWGLSGLRWATGGIRMMWSDG